MTYEELLMEAENEDLIVKEKNIPGYYGRIYKNRIAIHKKIETSVEKACVLAEELGHHHTTVGNILDLSQTRNAKQERQARLWAYNKQIGLQGLIDAHEARCKDWHEVAEYLDVTEEFLCEGVECYTRKYGIGVSVDNYYITFIPRLQIFKLI